MLFAAVVGCWEKEKTQVLLPHTGFRLDDERTALCFFFMVCLCWKVAAHVVAGCKWMGINQEKRDSCVKLPLGDEAPTVSHVCIS